jgi:hypothetical protein
LSGLGKSHSRHRYEMISTLPLGSDQAISLIFQNKHPKSRCFQFLNHHFQGKNRLSKPKIQAIFITAIFTTFYCNIKRLPWTDPISNSPT